jgi:hypothetical protein
MKKLIIATATIFILSGSAFAEQSNEGMNNREAMHQMLIMIKHEMQMMKTHMAALVKMQHKIESMEAGGGRAVH